MLDGINALFQSVGIFWTMLMELPFIGELTWGYFLIAVAVMNIFVTFLIFKLK